MKGAHHARTVVFQRKAICTGARRETIFRQLSAIPANTLALRLITRADAGVVASLHAASWRTAYRGILSDKYLAGDSLPLSRRGTIPRPSRHRHFLPV